MKQLNRSTKKVKDLSTLVRNKKFNFPHTFADSRDEYGRPCIFVMIQGKPTYIPTGEFIEIEYNVYCLLKDIGIIGRNIHLEEGVEFNPL